jgi:hypothetical protein
MMHGPPRSSGTSKKEKLNCLPSNQTKCHFEKRRNCTIHYRPDAMFTRLNTSRYQPRLVATLLKLTPNCLRQLLAYYVRTTDKATDPTSTSCQVHAYQTSFYRVELIESPFKAPKTLVVNRVNIPLIHILPVS